MIPRPNLTVFSLASEIVSFSERLSEMDLRSISIRDAYSAA